MGDFGRDFLRGIGASLNPQAASAIERGRQREAQATQFKEQQDLDARIRAEDIARKDNRFKITDKLAQDKLKNSRILAKNKLLGGTKSKLGKLRSELVIAQQDLASDPNNIDFQKQVGFAQKGINKEIETTKLFESTSTKEFVKLVATGRTIAEASRKSIITANNAIKLLDKGINTGFFANMKQIIGRVAKASGIPVSDKIPFTEQFRTVMGQAVLNIIGSGALGSGTAVSDNDVKFTQGVVAGDITLDENTIRRILSINAVANNEIIEKHNALADKEPNLKRFKIEPIKFKGNIVESDFEGPKNPISEQQDLPPEGFIINQKGKRFKITNGVPVEIN